jgi:eukaryotic-like serine/threonine-protein kinase
MPAPANADEFLEFIRKSGVAEENRLKGSLARITEQSGSVPTDPSELAKLLMRDGVLTFFQADQLLQGKWKRFFIGKYKVLERLGSGGMGQVFLCEHKLMRRRVALKVLPAARADDPSALERFYREARAVAALDHPNIVRAYDIDQDEKLHFLVMEYVDGSNLQDLVKKHGILDPIRACHYIYGSAVGLQHAHEMGLVHRDIKPGNILIDRTGVVKILDMGLARFFNDEDDMLTKKYDENILGTADYLAPEQAIDSHNVDIRADIYSLGATFYFLLTGLPPFPEGTVAQKLLWHQTREPAPLKGLRTDLPPALVDLIAKMMAKDTKDRFQAPGDVMTALSPWVQTPIPPPTDKEMPTLSPALMTSSTGPQSARTPSGAPSIVGGVSVKALPASGPPLSNGIGMPAVIPQAIRPPSSMSVQPAVSPPPEDQLWQSIAEDAEDKPVEFRPASVTKVEPATTVPEKKKSSKWLIVLLVGVFFIFGLLGTSAAVLAYLWLRPNTVSTFPAQKTWYVTANRNQSPDPTRTLSTLRGAIEQAGQDELILILDSRLEEPPFAFSDGQNKKKGLRIEPATPSKTVVWAPKQALITGSRAILDLADVENLRLTGLTFDLNNSIEVAVNIRGGCFGTILEDLNIKNPRVAGFRLTNVAGESGRSFKIQNCRVSTESKIESGIYLLGSVRNSEFIGNRFITPGGAAFKADSILREVEFKNNRVFNADYGLWLTGKPSPESAYSLTVSNNTFHTLSIAGVFCDLPLKEPKQSAQFKNNYFAATKLLFAAAPASAGFKFVANGRDPNSPEGQPLSQASPIESNLSIPTSVDLPSFLVPSRPLLHPSGVSVGASGS